MVEIWNSHFLVEFLVFFFFSFFRIPKVTGGLFQFSTGDRDDLGVFPGKVHRVSLPVSTMRDCIPPIYGHIGDGMGWFLLLASPHYTQ